MGLFIGAIFCFVIAYFIYQSMEKDKHNNFQQGILYKDFSAKYLGGLKTLEGGKDFQVLLNNDEIILDFNRLNQMPNGLKKINIKISSIIDISIKSEQEIRNNTSLSQFIVWGLLALNKQKTIVNNFITITYMDGLEENTIVFKTIEQEKLTLEVRKLKFGEI